MDADEGIILGAPGVQDSGVDFRLEGEGASLGAEAAFGLDTPTNTPCCSICGEGYLVTRLDNEAPVLGATKCGLFQLSAESGDFTPIQCADLLTEELSDSCGCEEDVAYKMSAATSGQETNTPITVSCSICGDGFVVKNTIFLLIIIVTTFVKVKYIVCVYQYFFASLTKSIRRIWIYFVSHTVAQNCNVQRDCIA